MPACMSTICPRTMIPVRPACRQGHHLDIETKRNETVRNDQQEFDYKD